MLGWRRLRSQDSRRCEVSVSMTSGTMRLQTSALCSGQVRLQFWCEGGELPLLALSHPKKSAGLNRGFSYGATSGVRSCLLDTVRSWRRHLSRTCLRQRQRNLQEVSGRKPTCSSAAPASKAAATAGNSMEIDFSWCGVTAVCRYRPKQMRHLQS